MKVLIVDDERSTLLLVSKLVEKMGHETILASNGVRAHQILEDNEDINLLITDLSMPEMGGKQLIKKILEMQRDIPIIVISGVVKFNEIHGILAIGANYFIPKPVDRKLLEDFINRCQGNSIETFINESDLI